MKDKIIRKIDELGRVVIPKEMRVLLNLKLGDDIEIITDGKEIIIKKSEVYKDDN